MSSLDYVYLQTKPAHGTKLKTELQNAFDHIRTLNGPNLFGIFDISRGFIKLLRLMFVYKQSNETSTLKNIGKGHTLTFSLPKRPFAEQPLIDNRAENPSK